MNCQNLSESNLSGHLHSMRVLHRSRVAVIRGLAELCVHSGILCAALLGTVLHVAGRTRPLLINRLGCHTGRSGSELLLLLLILQDVDV